MNISLKIWITAILYQTIIAIILTGIFVSPSENGLHDFAFPFITLFLIIELIGGLPGLLIFETGFSFLRSDNRKTRTRWVLTILLAAFAAFSTAFLTLIAIMALIDDFDSIRDFLPITLPSVFTALMSVCSFYKSIRSALNASVPAYIPPQEYIDTE